MLPLRPLGVSSGAFTKPCLMNSDDGQISSYFLDRDEHQEDDEWLRPTV